MLARGLRPNPPGTAVEVGMGDRSVPAHTFEGQTQCHSTLVLGS